MKEALIFPSQPLDFDCVGDQTKLPIKKVMKRASVEHIHERRREEPVTSSFSRDDIFACGVFISKSSGGVIKALR